VAHRPQARGAGESRGALAQSRALLESLVVEQPLPRGRVKRAVKPPDESRNGDSSGRVATEDAGVEDDDWHAVGLRSVPGRRTHVPAVDPLF
jgi:hypothetical protein